MQLVTGTPLPPSVCFICETHKEGLHVDTLRTHQTGVYSPLSGRKYVCEECVNEMGKLFGLASDARVKTAEAETAWARGTLKGVRQELALLSQKLSDLTQIDYPKEEVAVVQEEDEPASPAAGSIPDSGGEAAGAGESTPGIAGWPAGAVAATRSADFRVDI